MDIVNITADDLILEIGKLHVEKLSIAKTNMTLTNTLDGLKEESIVLIKDRKEFEVNNTLLVKSNSEYIKNNKTLDNTIVALRTEYKIQTAEMNDLREKLKKLEIVKIKKIIKKPIKSKLSTK